jgi:Flp pilus assembly protein CpaB
MRTRIVIIVVALAIGGIAAVFAARYLSEARSDIVAESTPVTVLVAAEDIPRGLSAEELVERELLEEQEIPQQFVSPDAVSSERSIQGQVLAVPLAEGEQVTQSRFQYPSEAGLTYTIPADHLAVTIPSDDIKGVAGFIKPGDSVAVVVSFPNGNWYTEDGEPLDPGEEDATPPLAFMDWDLGDALPDSEWVAEYPITRIALGSVKVLAVERDVTRTDETAGGEDGGGGLATSRNQQEEEQGTYDSVTLAVTASELEQLIFCEQFGNTWLALVGDETEDPDGTGRIYGNAFAE